MDKKTFYLVAAVLIFAAFFASSYLQSQEAKDAVGGDADEHGCIGSAGYSWSEEKQACVRPWEEQDQVACTMEARLCPDGSAVGRNGSNGCEFDPCPDAGTTIVGGDSDEHGCKASAGYSWCEEKGKCLRTWEESCSPDSGGEVIGGNPGLANPAAEYCRDLGLDYRIVDDESGQRGECLTKEGVWVDEWALYRDEIDVAQPLA